MATLADAYIRLRPSISGFSPELRRDAHNVGQAAGSAANRGFNDKFDVGNIVALTLGSLATKFGAIGALAGAATPSLINFAGSISKVGGLAIALPALLGGAAAAFGVVKLATTGLGDAIKSGLAGDWEKFHESVTKLPPGAQQAAFAIVGLRDRLTDLRASVANAFFFEFAESFRPLADSILPILNVRLVEIASSFGNVARGAMEAARSGPFLNGLNDVLGATAQAISAAWGGVRSLVNSLGVLFSVGAPTILQLGQLFTQAAQAAERWLIAARDSGQLASWLQAGKDTLATMVRILFDLGSIMFSVFKAGSTDGRNLLTTIEGITDTTAKWLKSTRGTEVLAEVFRTLNALGAGFRSAFGAALRTAGDVLLQLLPVVQELAPVATKFIIALLPAASIFVGVGLALEPLIPLLDSFSNFLLSNPSLVQSLALAIFFLVSGIKAYELAMSLAMLATKLWKTLQAGVILVTHGWTAAQIALNGALFANPIGLVIIAIAALVAGLVLAWKHSETFRNIVMAAWDGIRTAAIFAWENVLRPVLTALAHFFVNVVAPAAMWLWQNIIVPVWEGIKVAFNLGWAIVSAVFNAIRFVIENVVAPVVVWLWQHIIQPAWEGIKFAFNLGWAIISFVFAAIKFWIDNVVGPVIMFLWHNIVQPAWEGIKFAFELGWALISFVFNAIKAIIETVVAPVLNFLWHNVVEPVWNGIKDIFLGAWHFIRDNVINPLMNLLEVVLVGAFTRAKDMIGTVWTQVKDLVKAPIRFVIETVYRDGIKALWDKVAGAIGAPPLPDFPLPAGFAGGGIVPGRDSGKDEILAMLRRGEGVAVPELVSQIGASRFLSWNAKASRGQPIGFAEGGIVGQRMPGTGGPFDFIEDALGWFAGGLETAARAFVSKFVNPIIDRMPGGGSLKDFAKAIPNKMLEHIFTFLRRKDEEAMTLGGGPDQWRAMWAWVHGRFPFATLNSAFRPGDPGYHGRGWAIDIGTPDVTRGGPQAFAVFNAIKQTFKPNILELIYDFARGAAVWNGQDHFFTGGGAGPGTHNDHIHWANRAMGGFSLGSAVAGALGVARWAPLAAQVLRELGQYSPGNLSALLASIAQESGGNPNAVQHGYVDVNTLSGDLAKGLNQVIGSTFRAFAGPYVSLGQFHPYANLYASVRYAMARYGARWASVMAAPGGYDNGGQIAPGWSAIFNGTRKPENVTTHDKMEDVIDRLEKVIRAIEKVAPQLGNELRGASRGLVKSGRLA